MESHENEDGSFTIRLLPRAHAVSGKPVEEPEPPAEPAPAPAATIRTYDISIDAHRDATQLDFDLAAEGTRAYGELRAAVDRVHQQHRERVRLLLSRAGRPA